jgi:dTDP-4-amino-4,6-dideoxygalactose transaminase
MIVTDDAAVARRARMMRNHGLDPDAPAPDFVAAGFNMRLTEFQAALGSSQLGRLDDMLAARSERAKRYDELFSGSPVTPPFTPAACAHVYQAYVVLLPVSHAARRPEIIAGLRTDGIETTIGTYLMPFTTYYNARGRYAHGSFPTGEDVAARALALPLHVRLSEREQATVAERLFYHLA